MAGDWLKMEASTPDKPEVLAIAARMGWDDPDLAVGKLFRVWRWFDQHTTSGNAAGVTFALLDRISGVTGFAEAMESVGWLAISESGISLPNFDRHCGKTAKGRAQTAKRVAGHKSNAKGNAQSVTKVVPEALPREEKMLEKNKEQEHVRPTAARSRPAPTMNRFEEFCAVYPRREGLAVARGKWKMKNLDAVADKIIADIRKRIDGGHWTDPKYVPLMSTYINQQRWEDQVGTGGDLLQPVQQSHSRAAGRPLE